MNISRIKTSLATLLAGAALSAQVFAQVSTPVVGFSKIDIPGKVGSSSEFFTIIPVSLQKPSVFTGFGTASGTVISPSGASFASGGYNSGVTYATHYLVITSGSGSGLTSDVVSNTANTVTIQDDLSSYINAGDQFSIIPHQKVTDILGASGSQVINSGANTTAADNIYIVDASGALRLFYYKSGAGAGLKNSSNLDASGAIIYPGEALMVSRKLSTASSVTISGQVADFNTIVPILSGNTLTGGGYPLSLTLSQITPLVSQGANAGAADNVYWVDPTDGALKLYYYKSGAGAGWKNQANQNVSSTTVLNSGFLINRKAAGGVNFTQTKTW